MILKEGQVFYCPVCGLEIKVIKNGEPVLPLSCCGVPMTELNVAKKKMIPVFK